MAGSLADNIFLYKKKSYVPPTPPNELIDSTSFTVDFIERKFIHVGLNPAENFNTTIHVITSSRHVVISPEFLNRIFTLMGNILSFILDDSDRTSKTIFLEADSVKLSSMKYRGENMLVIESTVQEGCRVLLSRRDLITLQHMEWAIYATIMQKHTTVRPCVINQVEHIVNYFDKNCDEQDTSNFQELIRIIKNVHENNILDKMPKFVPNYINQLRLLAANQLADRWVQFISEKSIKPLSLISPLISPVYYKEINEEEVVKQPTSPLPMVVDESDGLTYSILSPPSITHEPSVRAKRAVDENDGPSYLKPSILSPPSITHEPSVRAKRAVDENDGPSYLKPLKKAHSQIMYNDPDYWLNRWDLNRATC